MNNIAKLSIGLVTTGAVATGAVFAGSFLSKGKVDSESSEIQDFVEESMEVVDRRNANRVTALEKVFAEYATTQEAKEDLAEIIKGQRYAYVVFHIKEGSTHFEDPGHVAAEITTWCDKREEVHRLASKYPNLQKNKICNLSE